MNKYAIVVGLSTKWLHGADNDARLTVRLLKQHGFKSRDIKVFINNKAERNNILDAYAWLREVCTPEDEIVIMYAGEGIGSRGLLWLNTLMPARYDRALILAHECYSGRYIPVLEGERRVVITSATASSPAADGKPYTVWGTLFLHNWYKIPHLSAQQAFEMAGIGMISDKYGKPMVL